MSHNFGRAKVILGGAAVLAIVSGGSAYAAATITSAQIVDDTIKSIDLKNGAGVTAQDLGPNLATKINSALQAGDLTDYAKSSDLAGLDQSADIDDLQDQIDALDQGLAGAIYRVEQYDNGGAGDATVACDDDPDISQQYTAIAGGVQAGKAEAGFDRTNAFDVAASFPGRMNWDTGEPKADRLDGWIVLGSGGYSDVLRVWALCVPTTSIPVDVVNLDN
jgi:hypothetical protein